MFRCEHEGNVAAKAEANDVSAGVICMGLDQRGEIGDAGFNGVRPDQGRRAEAM